MTMKNQRSIGSIIKSDTKQTVFPKRNKWIKGNHLRHVDDFAVVSVGVGGDGGGGSRLRGGPRLHQHGVIGVRIDGGHGCTRKYFFTASFDFFLVFYTTRVCRRRIFSCTSPQGFWPDRRKLGLVEPQRRAALPIHPNYLSYEDKIGFSRKKTLVGYRRWIGWPSAALLTAALTRFIK